MSVANGTKAFITKELYESASARLKDSGSDGVPYFIKEIEVKEEYLSDKIFKMATFMAKHHKDTILSNHNVVLTEKEESSIALDIYVMSWYHYVIADEAKDITENEKLDGLFRT